MPFWLTLPHLGMDIDSSVEDELKVQHTKQLDAINYKKKLLKI